jgi:hypothetical protein
LASPASRRKGNPLSEEGDNKIAPRRVVGRPFEKGKSGSPGGRPREIQEIVDLARTNSVDAVNTLARIMRDPDAPHQAQIAAANSMLDRAFGKPKETVDLTGKLTLEALVLASMRQRDADPNLVDAAVQPVAGAVPAPSLSSMVADSYAQPVASPTSEPANPPDRFAVVLDPSWQAPPTKSVSPDTPVPAQPETGQGSRFYQRGWVMDSGYAREGDAVTQNDFPDRGESLDSFMARTRNR